MTELKISQKMLENARVNKSIGWVTIDPWDFIFLTCTGSADKWIKEEIPYSKSLSEYNSHQADGMPWIGIDMASGKVVAHDGRHRAIAVMQAGGRSFPLSVTLYRNSYPTYYVMRADEDPSLGRSLEKRFLGMQDCPKTWKRQFEGSGSVFMPTSKWKGEFWINYNKVTASLATMPDMIESSFMHLREHLRAGFPDMLASELNDRMEAALKPNAPLAIQAMNFIPREADRPALQARETRAFSMAASVLRYMVSVEAAKPVPQNLKKLRERRKKVYEKTDKTNDAAQNELKNVKKQIKTIEDTRRTQQLHVTPKKKPIKPVQKVKPVEKETT